MNDEAGIGARPVEVGRLNFCDKLRHGKSFSLRRGKRQMQKKSAGGALVGKITSAHSF